MDGILQSYYQALGGNDDLLCRGAIAWAPSAFLQEKFWEVQFSSSNPAVDFGKGFITMKERTASQVHDPSTGIFHHNPIHHEHLRANEAMAALRLKRRKVIIISTGVELSGLGERAHRRVKSRFPECFLCAPLYTLSSDAEPDRYPASFISRAKAYGFPMLFYLGKDCGMRECCVRFDRIQAISREFLKPESLRISDDCQRVLDDWLQQYLFGEMPSDSEIIEYQQMLADSVKTS